MYPGFCPITIQIERSPCFSQLSRTPLCGCTRIYSTRYSCGHFGNFQYFAKSGRVVHVLIYLAIVRGVLSMPCKPECLHCWISCIKEQRHRGFPALAALCTYPLSDFPSQIPSLLIRASSMDDHSILSMGSLWGLNQLMCAKMLRTYLAHRKCSVKFAVCVCTRQCQGSTQAGKCLTIGSFPPAHPPKKPWLVVFANFYNLNMLSTYLTFFQP